MRIPFWKPASALNKNVSIDNDIIPDFFSGSATTAHALMQLDGGNRHFILVQLPQVTDGDEGAIRIITREIESLETYETVNTNHLNI